jgi:hypothetical protein
MSYPKGSVNAELIFSGRYGGSHTKMLGGVGVGEGNGREVSIGVIVLVSSKEDCGTIVRAVFDPRVLFPLLHPAVEKKIMNMKMNLIWAPVLIHKEPARD